MRKMKSEDEGEERVKVDQVEAQGKNEEEKRCTSGGREEADRKRIEEEGGAHGKRQKELESSVRRKMREVSEKRSSEKSQEGKEECRRPKKDRSGEGHERNTLTRKEKAKPSN